MRDEQHRLPAYEIGERGLDLVLRLGVGEGGGLIEDEHRRIDEDRAGDRDALSLPAREPAVLPEHRVEAVRQGVNLVEHPRRPGRCTDLLFTRAGASEGDVVADADREQLWVLQNEPDMSIEVLDVGNRRTTEADLAGARIVEAGEQRGDRRLAGAGWPDECGDSALTQAEGDVLQGELSAAV